jgi:hypothetical protein
MSKYTRYHIAKKVYQNHLILFTADNAFGLTSCYIDFDILFSAARKSKYKFRNFWGIRNYLIKHNISFIIFDNTNIMERYDAVENNYDKYYYLTCFRKIKNTIVGKYG